MLSLFPIDPIHSAITPSESVRDQFPVTLKYRIELSWQLISLFQIGGASNVTESLTVVVISSLTGHDRQSFVFRLEVSNNARRISKMKSCESSLLKSLVL